MNYMMAILPKMGGFLLLVLIGFTASRTGIIKKEAMPSISGFLLRIALPALTIGLILENQTTFQTMTQYGKMVLSQILMYFVMAAGGILGSHICHLKGATANVHCGCSVGGNYGFLVIPLITVWCSRRQCIYSYMFRYRHDSGLDSGFYIIYKWNRTERESLEKDHYESNFPFNPAGFMSDQFSYFCSGHNFEYHWFCWQYLLQLGAGLPWMQSWIYETHQYF